MRKKMKSATLLTAVIFGLISNAAYAEENISVKMNSVASNETQYVSFSGMKPIQVNNRTLVPARDMAVAAGMSVSWDQPTQTAILTLNASADSEKPVERFAAAAIDTIKDMAQGLTPINITAALRLEDNNAVIRYNFANSDGSITPVGKKYMMTSKAVFINDGTLMIPIRDSMEMFGLSVDWDQASLCAGVSIPYTVSVPTDLAVIDNPGEGEFAASQYTDVPAHGAYIGNFKITYYCPCSICNGGWGAYTAWAGEITPGRTIGVNPNIIPKLSWVYIDDYGYRRAEDTGDGIGEYHIDIAVPTHSAALALGTLYKDVYFAE